MRPDNRTYIALAVRYVQRERAGSSASMNPSLEYLELNVVTAVINALIAQERDATGKAEVRSEHDEN